MKGRVLVTGATGFLGTHLVERLLEAKTRVKVLTRSSAPELRAQGVEVVEGSILDEAACASAVEGASAVFHLAGQVSRNPDDGALLYEVHVRGTAVLCKAAKKAGVERMVLASTSGTIAVTENGDTIPDETFPPPLKLIGKWPYYTSKLYQEETARRECAGGPELVILNPSLLLGPGDKKLSSTEDVLKLLASEIPVIPPGGVNFVDVRDAALAFESALSRGRPGERYLLGGPNWSFETFFARISRTAGVRGPRVKLPEHDVLVRGKGGRCLLPAVGPNAAGRSHERRDGPEVLVARPLEGGAGARLYGSRSLRDPLRNDRIHKKGVPEPESFRSRWGRIQEHPRCPLDNPGPRIASARRGGSHLESTSALHCLCLDRFLANSLGTRSLFVELRKKGRRYRPAVEQRAPPGRSERALQPRGHGAGLAVRAHLDVRRLGGVRPPRARNAYRRFPSTPEGRENPRKQAHRRELRRVPCSRRSVPNRDNGSLRILSCWTWD